MNRTSRLWPIVLVLLGAASYGLGTTALKLAIADGWGVKHLTFHQVLFGAVMLWLVLAVTRLNRDRGKSTRKGASTFKHSWRVWLLLVMIGVVGLSLTTVFYNEALVRLDASLGIVLLFQFTWITILLESIRKRKWPTRQEWIAVVCIALGTILAVGLLEHDFSQLNGLGIIYGLLSAVTYSLFFFLTGFLPVQLDTLAKSAIMSTISLLFIMILQATGTFDWSFDLDLLGWGLLLGFLGTAFPFFCFNYGIPKVGSGMAALLGSMELPAAVIAAFILLGEPLSLWQGSGIVLILAGIMAAERKSQQQQQSATVGKEGEE